jgi:hypothetical protein
MQAARLGRSGGSGQRRSLRQLSTRQYLSDTVAAAVCITSDLPAIGQKSVSAADQRVVCRRS